MNAMQTLISGRGDDFYSLSEAHYGLPHGLKYDRNTRTISGTPRECGHFVFVLPPGEHMASLDIFVVPGKSPCGWAGIPPLSPGAVFSARAKGMKLP